MDPNEALEQIRKHAKDIGHQLDREELSVGSESAVPVCALLASMSELLDYINGLDAWLCQGGFLPDAWQRH